MNGPPTPPRAPGHAVPAARRGPLRPLSVAPMMHRTDRHFRWILRRLTRRTLLYTEMITSGAILNGDRRRLLGFSEDEHPIALQIGGDDPAELARAATVGAELGYDEINLNVGCPSDAVQRGRFGACLMAEPERVADAVAALREAVPLPVTVKHRIGIDDRDRYDDMERFVTTVAGAGCDRFIVHARKAWLRGLSPKQNRNVPPLRHEEVHRLKREHPELAIEINGGIRSLDAARDHLGRVDGVMIGRAAHDAPFLLAAADREIFGDPAPGAPTRRDVVLAAAGYAERWAARGVRTKAIAVHLPGIASGLRGARGWRRFLAGRVLVRGATPADLRAALEHLPEEPREAPAATPKERPQVPTGL